MNKGFTLVELLASLVILAIIMVISVPLILNSREEATGVISEQEKAVIVEAAKLLAMDLDDYTSDVYNCKSGVTSSCSKSSGVWTKVTVTVDALKNYDYLTDSDNHCSGTVTITKNGYDYTVTTTNVTCND